MFRKHIYNVTVELDGRAPWLGAKDMFDGIETVVVMVTARSYNGAEKVAYEHIRKNYDRYRAWSYFVRSIEYVSPFNKDN